VSRYFYCFTVTVLLLWGALSDDRTGLSFIYAAGSSQHSLSQARVPWNSRPYFTVSDLRLPFSSPLAPVVLLITPRHGPSREHRFQQSLYCSVRIRCSGNLLTSRCLETNVVSEPSVSSGCFSGSTILVSSKYDAIYIYSERERALWRESESEREEIYFVILYLTTFYLSLKHRIVH
jgi:hypothetical protein